MSSFGYISYPIASDATAILADMYAYIKSKAPAWRENDANLDTWMLQVAATEASDLRELATDVPDTIFRYYGMVLFNIQAVDAASATVDSTWVVKDTAGYTIPAGTNVTIRDDVGNDWAFSTLVDVIVPGGVSSTGAGAVPLRAVIPGAAASDIGGVGVQASLVDVLEFVVSVTLTAQTSGGVDAETSTQYNDRLARRLRRLSTRPILPEDFASMALDIEGVYRAVAIDGYNPADGTTNNERMIAIAAVDAAGVQASTTIKNEIDAYVEANREANFICNMMDPVYTIVDVTFVAALAPGFDQATVQTNAINAVKAYLNKATWGRDPHYTSGQDGDDSSAQTWVQSTTVYYSQVMKAIMDTDGITNVVTLLIGPHLGTLSAADLPIVGPAALADAGTITGTVS